MPLSDYHRKYSDLPDEEIARRAAEKKSELESIFRQARPTLAAGPARIAILGCGDKRLIAHHKEIFERLLDRPVQMTTFDIAADHLAGGQDVVRHDCTLPLPNRPYDVTYAHVVLKFIETEQQWNLIENSIDALRPGGMSIHVLDRGDYGTEDRLLPGGQFSVPLERWKDRIKGLGLNFFELPVKYGLALVIRK